MTTLFKQIPDESDDRKLVRETLDCIMGKKVFVEKNLRSMRELTDCDRQIDTFLDGW
jgi:hypothetical protein